MAISNYNDTRAGGPSSGSSSESSLGCNTGTFELVLGSKELTKDSPIRVCVSETDTVGAVKAKIQEQEGVHCDAMRIMTAGRDLDDNATLRECGIDADSALGSGMPVHLRQSAGRTGAMEALYGQFDENGDDALDSFFYRIFIYFFYKI